MYLQKILGGFDAEFQNMIIMMYQIEVFGACIPLAFNSAVMALL